MASIFRSLKTYNYRLWAGGALVSNIGTWFQRVAQDWLVLTQLTDHSATALGVTMALQFAPLVFILPFSGFAADRLDRRKLVMATQAVQAALALCLGVLTLTGLIALWHVYVLATLLGIVTSFDGPARQAFVSELVDENDLPNALALNSTIFNLGRMIGPALSGILIAATGTGWAFIINAASFAAVLLTLALLRVSELRPVDQGEAPASGLMAGFSYVRHRPDLTCILIMGFIVGTFGLNFPIYISTMAVSVFGVGAREYGVLMSMLSIGTIAGALMAAGRGRPHMAYLLAGAVAFGVGCGLASAAPNYSLFALSLIIVGLAAMTFTNSTNSLSQISTAPAMRGRVLAIRQAVQTGGTPIGAPIVGWVADRFGPRWALAVGAMSGVVAAAVAVRYLVHYRQLRIGRNGARIRLLLGEEGGDKEGNGSS